MGSSRSKLILAAIALLAIIAFFWSRHHGRSAEELIAEESEETATANTQTTTATDPIATATGDVGIATVNPSVTPTPIGSTDEASFREALRKCWGEFQSGPMNESGDAQALLQSLNREEAALTQTIFENYHISTNEGERRVQVLFQDNQPSQLRFFGVDDEDLPIPIQPEDSNKRPIEQALQDFLRRGNQTLHQVRRELNLKNGITAEVETINDNPTEIQLHGLPGGTFACEKDSCRCITYEPPPEDGNAQPFNTPPDDPENESP